MNRNFLHLYQNLTAYGNVYPLKHKMEDTHKLVNWTEDNFEYVRYNPRTKNERYGLSVTSLDGGVSGVPDLDSLPQFNKENNTNYHETDFCKFTPVYENKKIQTILEPIKDSIFRTHILKFKPGGFFPPHRDTTRDVFDTFRLLIPLKNTVPPAFNFIVDGVLQYWTQGVVYFVDTAKMHYVFNCSNSSSSYMLVINTKLTEETVNYVTSNLLHC